MDPTTLLVGRIAQLLVCESEHWAVLDKPRGVLTVPGRGAAEADRAVLGLALQAALGGRIYPVHRLDLPVSGLVLFARDAAAHARANGWFERRLVHKTYRAWTRAQGFEHLPARVPGPRKRIDPVPGQRFEWAGRIWRGKRRAFQSPRGVPSLTRATFLGTDPASGYLVWDLEPVTGRPHQLRLDLSRHGFPVLGDSLYGSAVDLGAGAIALRAYRLDLCAVDPGLRPGLPPCLEVSPQDWDTPGAVKDLAARPPF
jgi:tRNA pseudouridine32 synthase/23S rRNA pseudouridine746 synthase